MSTLAQIEKAIESLPASQVGELARWLERFCSRGGIAPSGTNHDLDGLIGSWREDAGFDAAVRAFEQVDEAMWK